MLKFILSHQLSILVGLLAHLFHRPIFPILILQHLQSPRLLLLCLAVLGPWCPRLQFVINVVVPCKVTADSGQDVHMDVGDGLAGVPTILDGHVECSGGWGGWWYVSAFSFFSRRFLAIIASDTSAKIPPPQHILHPPHRRPQIGVFLLGQVGQPRYHAGGDDQDVARDDGTEVDNGRRQTRGRSVEQLGRGDGEAAELDWEGCCRVVVIVAVVVGGVVSVV
mmetsp:Transcript_18915/g.54509  ORF Transcript_18915/g.54509 Transcript_18915/m.54509 type:complete len:222 (-) Transcript_18915:174-839(-)